MATEDDSDRLWRADAEPRDRKSKRRSSMPIFALGGSHIPGHLSWSGSANRLSHLPQLSDATQNRDHHARIAALIKTSSASDQSAGHDSPQRPESGDRNVENDGTNPKSWPRSKKTIQMVILSWTALVTSIGSLLMTPGLPSMAQELQITSKPMIELSVCAALLGSAVSSLLAAPLSEMYGRIPLYHASNVCFAVFTLLCGFAQSPAEIVLFRFLVGLLGQSALAVMGGTATDIYQPQQRARALGIAAFGPLLGPCIGPIIGGAIVHSKGWRWPFFGLAIVAGVNVLVCAALLEETYAPVLLERNAKRLRRQTGCESLPAKLNNNRQSAAKALGLALARPAKLLLYSPVVALCSLVSAVLFGVLYLLLTSIPFVFGPLYSFSTLEVGLVYIAPALGMVIGLFSSTYCSDRNVSSAQKEGHRHIPEHRLALPLLTSGAFTIIAGLLLYGWSAQYLVHWFAACLGLTIYCIGLQILNACVYTYLVESYLVYAASVGSVSMASKLLANGILPLSGLSLFDRLNLGWGCTLLAGISLLGVTGLLACHFGGSHLRSRFVVKL
ncbi:hypothetical protein CERZMDRAFT_114089 [Cercospora zeae-maydis SCOH1-5]|uniref:Major facilitator superfamily (MFS) profile domain-containing protein n=1 Tax=Cercospora zeae-maydis SCOH1-5 TaxID=717836 RepID=A0A6A6F6P1_9PEZI|nr:hypothetical protein CERZMDRAFT_114089 [Cercospora zeae-maydis SCOH1-5]